MSMTSQEIADLTGASHESIKRLIATLAEQGVIQPPRIEQVAKPDKGPGPKVVIVYHIGRSDGDAVAARRLSRLNRKTPTPEERKETKRAYDATPKARSAKAARESMPKAVERKSAYGKRYRDAHAEKIKARAFENYHRTKDEKREYRAVKSKESRDRNKANIKMRRQVDFLVNPSHRERAIERSRKWNMANKERAAKTMRDYYLKNKARIVGRTFAYKKANPESALLSGRICRSRRRGRLLDAGGSFTKQDIQRLFSLQKGKCANCHVSLDDSYHIDHRIPVAKGGSSHPHNLELLCPHCNTSKGARWPHEFAQENGRLL